MNYFNKISIAFNEEYLLKREEACDIKHNLNGQVPS